MKNYLEVMRHALETLLGSGDVSSLDYKELPEEKELYNASLTIGNVNLTAGRFKTESEADKVVEEFLAICLP